MRQYGLRVARIERRSGHPATRPTEPALGLSRFVERIDLRMGEAPCPQTPPERGPAGDRRGRAPRQPQCVTWGMLAWTPYGAPSQPCGRPPSGRRKRTAAPSTSSVTMRWARSPRELVAGADLDISSPMRRRIRFGLNRPLLEAVDRPWRLGLYFPPRPQRRPQPSHSIRRTPAYFLYIVSDTHFLMIRHNPGYDHRG